LFIGKVTIKFKKKKEHEFTGNNQLENIEMINKNYTCFLTSEHIMSTPKLWCAQGGYIPMGFFCF
jgi:hypothetical protein